MKKNLAIFLIALPCTVGAQFLQKEVSVGYAYTSPRTDMKHYIQQGNGIVLEGFFHNASKRVSLGAELNFSIYGNDMDEQEYEFEDGTIAPMNVTVSNYFLNMMAVGRYYMLESKIVQPYISGKVGYSHWVTELSITDPDDLDNCEPVESDILKEDGGMLATVGGGIRFDVGSVFKGLGLDRMFLDVSTAYSKGGRIQYMSTDPPKNSPHHSMSTDVVNAQFRNTQTQIVHKHHVGYVYDSYIEMLDFRFNMAFRF